MKKICVLFLAAFFIHPPARAQTLELSPGDPGGLAAAVTQLKAGDTLRLEPGVYRQTARFASSGTAENPISIEGAPETVFDGDSLPKNTPVFDTNGQSFLSFKNFKVIGARAAVLIRKGSHDIAIDGLRTERCQFAVKMSDAWNVTVTNSSAADSRNAFRGDGQTHHVAFDNVRTSGSKDVYKGYNPDYLNGDGFIFENKTHHLTFRNIVTHGHWDAGIDCKGSHALIENVTAFGNKNGLKLWGADIEVRNCLLYGNKKQKTSKGHVDGNGVNVRQRGRVTIVHSTIADNDDVDVKVGTPSSDVTLEDSVVARKIADGKLLALYGAFREKNVVWFAKHPGARLVPDPAASLWADPGFVDWEAGDYRLRPDGAASRRGAGRSGA